MVDEDERLRSWLGGKTDTMESLMGEGDAGRRGAALMASAADATLFEMERLNGRPLDLREVGTRFALIRSLLGR